MVALIELADATLPGTELVLKERSEIAGWLIAPSLELLCMKFERKIALEPSVDRRVIMQQTLNAIVRQVIPKIAAGTKYDFHNGYVLLTQ